MSVGGYIFNVGPSDVRFGDITNIKEIKAEATIKNGTIEATAKIVSSTT